MRKNALTPLLASVVLILTTSLASGQTDLGNFGTLGNDLTDLGDDGSEGAYSPPALAGFDAEFFGDDEPNFNPPNNEGAFNVFDNNVGGGQNKWCCSSANAGDGVHVGADFSNTLATGTLGIELTSFTITSDNDVGTSRDPDIWAIQGSNDGTMWTDIFTYNLDGNSPFDDFGGSVDNRTLQYVAGADFAEPEPFKMFRYLATSSVNNANHALSELEFFGDVVDTADVVPEPGTIAIWSLLGLVGLGLVLRRKKAGK